MNDSYVSPKPDVEINILPSSQLWKGQMRLDAAHYSKTKPEVLRLLAESGYELIPIDGLSERIFNLARFKRVYATNPNEGWPYMTPGQLVMFRCYRASNRFISKIRAPKGAKEHFVKRDWVLVTCSGTVGRIILATEPLEKYFLTHDLIRIVPKKNVKSGYLAAYLSCWIGQTLIKDQYGSTIDHIEPSHVAPLPVPILPENIQNEVDKKMREACQLRDQANKLIDEAEEIVEKCITKKNVRK